MMNEVMVLIVKVLGLWLLWLLPAVGTGFAAWVHVFKGYEGHKTLFWCIVFCSVAAFLGDVVLTVYLGVKMGKF